MYLAQSKSTSPLLLLLQLQLHFIILGSLLHQSRSERTDATNDRKMRIATSLSLLFFITVHFAAAVPYAHLHDPCGPVVQGNNLPNNTCNRTLDLVTAPSIYGALLLNDGSGLTIPWYNCLPVAYDACAAINSSDTPVGVWNWTDPGSSCVMGFWLPQYNGSAPRPTYDACMNNIYIPMYNIGMDFGGKAYNQVTVNLVKLPDNYQTGSQVDVGYPSYTITYYPLQQRGSTPLSR